MELALQITLVVTSVLVILLVLLHRAKGGGLSTLFGGGVQSSLSGSTVVEKNLDRLTLFVTGIWVVSHHRRRSADQVRVARSFVTPAGSAPAAAVASTEHCRRSAAFGENCPGCAGRCGQGALLDPRHQVDAGGSAVRQHGSRYGPLYDDRLTIA